MAASKEMFRGSALQELNSPDQLDKRLVVTKPAGWIGLASVSFVIAAVAAWGVLGSIDTKVRGEGIMVNPLGISVVESSGAGRVEEVHYRVGDQVAKGDLIATLSMPLLKNRVDDALAVRKEAEQRRDQSLKSMVSEAELEKVSINSQRETLTANRKGIDARIKLIEKRLSDRLELFHDGLVTEEQLYETRSDLAAAKNQRRQADDGLKDLDLREKESFNRREEVQWNHEVAVKNATRDWESLVERYQTQSRVISDYTGKVIEVTTDIGRLIREDESIVTVEPVDAEIEVILYVSPTQGKRIKEGMSIHLSPTTVKKEEHGLIVGTVQRVSEYPATREGMQALLSNEELVTEFTKDGPPISVKASILPDPTTVSGFKWTSGAGAPVRIGNGTLCGGEVIVASRAPVELVIPYLKSRLGQ